MLHEPGYLVKATDVTALHSGRRCYWVRCRHCGKVLTEATSNPIQTIECHDQARSAGEVCVKPPARKRKA